MKLPDRDLARVERAKITDYLLSSSHPDGRSKAAFFLRVGFKVEEWELLAEALRAVGVSNPMSGVMESPHGSRYTVDGPMQAPDGRAPMTRTVWVVEPGRPPRLVTAYPL